MSSSDDRIANNVLAARVRREVVDITTQGLQALPPKPSADGETTLRDEIALGDKSGKPLMKEALASAPAPWTADSTNSQLDRLLKLMAAACKSPNFRLTKTET